MELVVRGRGERSVDGVFDFAHVRQSRRVYGDRIVDGDILIERDDHRDRSAAATIAVTDPLPPPATPAGFAVSMGCTMSTTRWRWRATSRRPRTACPCRLARST